MGFFNTSSDFTNQPLRTQADIVAAATEQKPLRVDEDMNLPGVSVIHLMSEEELFNFLMMAIRLRPNPLGLELRLGDYKVSQQESTIPNSQRFFDNSIPLDDRIKSLIASLSSNRLVVGVKVSPLLNQQEQIVGCKTVLLVADKEAKPNDPEFNPKLILSYRP